MAKEKSNATATLPTPVMILWKSVLMVSLIGKVDSERAQEVMEAILKKVLNTESKIVILDILGVYPIDSEVANHLIKITKATKLMGCDCVITGITPSISQTFVNLGVELGDVITSSNLKDGLEKAFGMLDLEVREIKKVIEKK